MLSPGRWHEMVPKDPQANLRFRRNLLQKARNNPAIKRALREACKQDIIFYTNAFAWTYNPRKKNKVIPFITWPFQDRAFRKILDHVESQSDLVIEKSRDMGASWICITAVEWLWHFQEWIQGLVVSREGELVDGKTPDALFWKIDFLHRWMPDWLMPDWDPRFQRTKRYVENPETNSTITGQATTEKIGIGGRATVGLFDEFSRVDRGFEVRDGTADTTDCRIFNSTHTGQQTAFHAITTNGVTDKLVMHWSEHPTKAKGLYRYDDSNNKVIVLDTSYVFPPDFDFVMDGSPSGGPFPGLRSPWYDAECERRGSKRAIAMDLDIDVAGSTSLFFDPLLLRRLIADYTMEPYWQGDISYDREMGKPDGLITSPGGPLKLWCKLIADDRPPRGRYAIGADLSTGSGKTPACLSILDCKTGEKVGEYVSSIHDAKAMAPIATSLAWMFRDDEGEPAKLIWEAQGPGAAFTVRVLEMGFGNIYYRTDESPHTTLIKVSTRPGWMSNPETKRVLLEDYRSALSMRQFVNRSEAALKECLLFRYTPKGSVEHSQIASKDDPTGAMVNHSDRVIADALAWKLVKAGGMMAYQKKDEKRVALGSLQWRRELSRSSTKGDGWGG